MVKLGVICSAGGSALFSALDLLNAQAPGSAPEVLLITDRECAAEVHCDQHGIDRKRIEYTNRYSFSAEASKVFRARNCDAVLLFYSRLVSATLYEQIPTINIHPSLLPVFPGMGAVKMAHDMGARFLGASAHMVNKDIDKGPLIAQVVSPVSMDGDLASSNRLSYLQKVYLTLVMIDMLTHDAIHIHPGECRYEYTRQLQTSCSASPILVSADLRKSFDDFQKQQGLIAIHS